MVLVSVFAFSVTTLAQNNQFQLAPKEKLAKFYKAQFKRFYDSIPVDISQKYATTIAKIDQKIEDENIKEKFKLALRFLLKVKMSGL